MGQKVALILGIGGQDGSYLAEQLLGERYVVHGLVRRSSVDNLWRIRHLGNLVVLHYGDLADDGSIRRTLRACTPDEVYNEADQDQIEFSRYAPAYSADITGAAVGRLLRAVLDECPNARVFQPLSATVFGGGICDETTPFTPRSPYACAKVYAYHICQYYRTLGVEVSTAFFLNHDSPRRGSNYLLQKIAAGVVNWKRGVKTPIPLGNLDYEVDIGHAADYVRAARLINSYESPEDWVVGTGFPLTIMDWLLLGIAQTGVQYDPRLIGQEGLSRPIDPPLIADITRIKTLLGWQPLVTPAEIMRQLVERHEGDHLHDSGRS